MPVKYNITSYEGETQDVSVFLGSINLVATAANPQFAAIVEYLETGGDDPETIKEFFDMAMVIGTKFAPLSERVSAYNGRIYFDGMEVHDAVAQTIINFQQAKKQDFMPLVYFMEKIATNPMAHSRENLFRWMGRHDFAIASDGDIVAYKGVDKSENQFFSKTSGRAYVNGQLYEGKIPNQPGTIVEMPRDQVQHDPSVACHTGLHVGNWRYARNFAGTVVRCKINPRDVVSVPSDSSNEKMRVCRYRVLDKVDFEDKDLLFVGREVTKPVAPIKDKTIKTKVPTPGRAAKSKAKKAVKAEIQFPSTYEQYRKAHFAAMSRTDLRWLAKEWGVAVPFPGRIEDFAHKLDYAARGRRARNVAETKRK